MMYLPIRRSVGCGGGGGNGRGAEGGGGGGERGGGGEGWRGGGNDRSSRCKVWDRDESHRGFDSVWIQRWYRRRRRPLGDCRLRRLGRHLRGLTGVGHIVWGTTR